MGQHSAFQPFFQVVLFPRFPFIPNFPLPTHSSVVKYFPRSSICIKVAEFILKYYYHKQQQIKSWRPYKRDVQIGACEIYHSIKILNRKL